MNLLKLKNSFLKYSFVLAKPVSLFAFLCFYALFLPAQSRGDLEETRRLLLKDISQTTRLLKNTKKNKEATMDRFLTLRRQIGKRQKLVETLRSEIELADASIDRATIAVEAMTKDVERLKEEYASMLRTAYRHKLNNSTLLFLFSSNNFNEAYRRYRYLKQYNIYRSKQANLIIETLNTLNQKKEQLQAKRSQKQTLLDTNEEQNELLADELKVKDQLLLALQKDEKRLSSDLANQKQRHEKLNTAIEGIIRDEIAVRRKRTRTPALKKENFRAEEEYKSLTGSFERNKGNLTMPVRGVITKFFGKQQHPTMKNITIDSPGIDIKTDKGTEVRAVFKGEVVGIQFIPGYNNMLILKHGQYYTVYSNLTNLKVERGTKVKTREVLGSVSTDRITGTSILHFEVWREKTRLNPTRWVK